MSPRKWIPCILLIITMGGGSLILRHACLVGAAYQAKTVCSGIYVSGRDLQTIQSQELGRLHGWFRFDIPPEKQVVTVSLLGLWPRRAFFRPGLGCTVEPLHPGDGSWSKANSIVTDAGHSGSASQAFWGNDLDFAEHVREPHSLREVLDRYLDDQPAYQTWAMVVVHNDRLVAERYAPGVAPATRLPGWSLAKSVVNALVGILVGQGELDLHEPVAQPAWAAVEDPRQKISLDDLLRMQSGLSFGERYGTPFADAGIMLYLSPDAAGYAADLPLANPVGTFWHYSSGTTNIICDLLRRKLGGDLADTVRFGGKFLFERIGMTGTLIEPDAAGNLVGSSHIFATARSWTRFALLYLHDGWWQDDRVLPEGWVAYSRTPSANSPMGKYGAHFWTNGGSQTPMHARPYPKLPADAFWASGYGGQHVTIIPSAGLVVVRLGMSVPPVQWPMAAFVADVLAAVTGEGTVETGIGPVGRQHVVGIDGNGRYGNGLAGLFGHMLPDYGNERIGFAVGKHHADHPVDALGIGMDQMRFQGIGFPIK